MLVICQEPHQGQPQAPLTPAQKAAPHEKSAICALVCGILFGLEFLLGQDLISSVAIFFPLSAACLLYAALEAKLAYDIHRGHV